MKIGKRRRVRKVPEQLVPRKSMCVANESCGVCSFVDLIYVVGLLDERAAGAADRLNG